MIFRAQNSALSVWRNGNRSTFNNSFKNVPMRPAGRCRITRLRNGWFISAWQVSAGVTEHCVDERFV